MSGQGVTGGVYRTFYGVRVRVNPEDHPRSFLRESVRYEAMRDNMEALLRCVPHSERRLYSHLAPAYAHILSVCEWHRRLDGRERECQSDLQFPDFVVPRRDDGPGTTRFAGGGF